jgi:hypothetical protein
VVGVWDDHAAGVGDVDDEPLGDRRDLRVVVVAVDDQGWSGDVAQARFGVAVREVREERFAGDSAFGALSATIASMSSAPGAARPRDAQIDSSSAARAAASRCRRPAA